MVAAVIVAVSTSPWPSACPGAPDALQPQDLDLGLEGRPVTRIGAALPPLLGGERVGQPGVPSEPSENREIGVAAELGGAVQDAGLPSHEQRPPPPRFDRRKHSAYRVRDQAILRGRGTSSRAFRFPGSARAEKGRTSRPIRGQPRPLRGPRRDTTARRSARQTIGARPAARRINLNHLTRLIFGGVSRVTNPVPSSRPAPSPTTSPARWRVPERYTSGGGSAPPSGAPDIHQVFRNHGI